MTHQFIAFLGKMADGDDGIPPKRQKTLASFGFNIPDKEEAGPSQ